MPAIPLQGRKPRSSLAGIMVVTLHNNQRQTGVALSPYALGEVERIVQKGSVSRGEMICPNIGTAAIHAIYQHGGIITAEDAQYIVAEATSGLRSISTIAEQQQRHIANLLSRLTATSLERVKLIDVCDLDASSGSSGHIVAAYWAAVQMIDDVHRRQTEPECADAWPADWNQDELRVASVVIASIRWFQLYGEVDGSIIRRLRESSEI